LPVEVIEVAVALKRENPARIAAQVRWILCAQMGWSPSERTRPPRRGRAGRECGACVVPS
jgi:putative transposase